MSQIQHDKYEHHSGQPLIHWMWTATRIIGGGVLILTGMATGASSAQQTPPALVLTNVTVVDVETGTLIPGQRVLIVGNHIRAVDDGKRGKMPNQAQVMNGRGKYLIPGLWDMHAHAARAPKHFYPLLIANGVTGIREPGASLPLDTLLRWRREILAGTRVGPPRQILSAQSIAGPVASCVRTLEDGAQTCVADSTDARHYVDSLKAAGADMIKPRAVSRELYFTIAAESRRLKIPFGGHAEHVTAVEASDSGASLIDHYLRFNGEWGSKEFHESCTAASATVERCRSVAERLRRNGTWLVADAGRDWGPAFEAHLKAYESKIRWTGAGNWLHNDSVNVSPESSSMRIVQQAGVPIVAGTDGGDYMPLGFLLPAEVAAYVRRGLTPLNALQSATLNPAKALHATDSLGTVAPGKLADLVLLEGDPLADITNLTTIAAVIANGRYFDRAALDRLLAEVQALPKRWYKERGFVN